MNTPDYILENIADDTDMHRAPEGECVKCHHALREFSGYACNVCGHHCKSWTAPRVPEGERDDIKCYANPAIAALFEACPDHEICNRCGCCDQVWESCEPCGGLGVFEGDEEDIEWGEEFYDCHTCRGEGGWSMCIGRCDKNGVHQQEKSA